MSLTRHYRRLLLTYPRAYRRAGGEEILGLLDTTPPGRTRPVRAGPRRVRAAQAGRVGGAGVPASLAVLRRTGFIPAGEVLFNGQPGLRHVRDLGNGAGMTVEEVHSVLDGLAAVGCPAWIGGGRGVDTLVGEQTRPHRDLDLAIPAEHESAALRALAQLGYVVETDWRPVRVEVVADGRGRVDLCRASLPTWCPLTHRRRSRLRAVWLLACILPTVSGLWFPHRRRGNPLRPPERPESHGAWTAETD